MFNMGVIFHQAGRLEEMVETYRQLIGKFADRAEPQLKEPVLRATYNLAKGLEEQEHLTEAAATYRDLIRRFGDSEESTLIGWAMANLGGVLRRVGQYDQAIAAYRDLIGRFGDSTDSELKEQVAQAMIELANELLRAGKHDQAELALHDCIGRLDNNADPLMNLRVALVMCDLGRALFNANECERAVAALKELIARWKTTAEPKMQVIVGSASFLLAVWLRELNRNAEGVEVAARLVDDTDAIGDVALGAAARLTLADNLQALGRLTEARLVQAEAVRRLAEASNVRSGPYTEDLESIGRALRTTLIRLPLAEAKELFDEITTTASPAMRVLIQFGRFVLDVLMADEIAAKKAKLGPAARRKRALERVPPELRQTVIESADMIKRARAEQDRQVNLKRQEEPESRTTRQTRHEKTHGEADAGKTL
jgi:tetratricopeptide (TPR) repeat protein